MVGSRAVEKQQKTVLGVVLLLLFGALACCGLTVAIFAWSGYQDALKDAEAALAEPDAGPEADEAADPTPPDATDDAPVADAPTEADVPEAPEEPVLPELPATWAEAKGKVLVTVRERIFVELLEIRGGKTPLLQRPLADDLVELAVFDGPEAMQFLSTEQVGAWGQEPEAVFEHGRKQLAARSKKAFVTRAPGVYESAWADNYDLGRIVLFDLVRKLKVKGDPVLFIPQRDHLIITGAEDEKGLEVAGELVDERLRLDKPLSGRGWQLTASGLEPWTPEPDTLLATLRLEALAQDANEQKKALDEKFTQAGADIFVGTTLFVEDDEGLKHTYAVWTKGAVTLMPRAEFVAFVDVDMPEADRVVAAAPWEDVEKRVGGKMKREAELWPVRYRISSFPDKKTLGAIGTHPFFLRNKQ